MKKLIVSLSVVVLAVMLANSAEAGWRRYRAPIVVYRPIAPVVRMAPRYVAPVVPYYPYRSVYVNPYRYYGPGVGVVVQRGFYGGGVMVRTPGLGLNIGY